MQKILTTQVGTLLKQKMHDITFNYTQHVTKITIHYSLTI